MTDKSGNKASNLHKLMQAGFRVPDFFVCGSNTSEEELLSKIKQQFNHNKWFAVRSSSSAEDSKTSSMAGMFYSAVGVKKEDVFKEYCKVTDSYKGGDGGVIIQQFIPAEISGVMFSDNGYGQIIINANKGLCKKVVEGGECDEYVIDETGKIIYQSIPGQKEYLRFMDGEFTSNTTPDCSLSLKNIRQLLTVASQIQSLFKAPQDIEWSYYKEKLYILQSRPVTREISCYKPLVFYDSANIAESYSGIVLPLTISFALHIYKEVYRNLICSSGVSRKKVKKYHEVFDNMIAHFYGRLYYNMNNWYRMTAFIPGYKRNKRNLEQMITSNIRDDVAHDILPSYGLRFRYPLIVIRKLLFFSTIQNRFEHKVKTAIQNIRKISFTDLNYYECTDLFRKIDKELLQIWHIPVENDFMVMTFYGLLQKMFDEKELSSLIGFKSKTSEQVDALRRIRSALADSGLTDVLCKIPEEEFMNKLNCEVHIKEMIHDYFEEYGGRFANELKLESSDIEEDFDKFLKLLNLYNDLDEKPNKRSFVRADGWTKKYVLSKFKGYASRREKMRLLRSNCFSLVRRIFNRVGEIFYEEGKLKVPGDIYYLTMDEVFACLPEYKEIVAGREKDYKNFEDITPPAYFSLSEGEMPPIENKNLTEDKYFKGRVCSGGKVKGRIRVFKKYELPGSIDFDIIVTGHTDPGWTPLLALTKGLIVEHGGILSHAAIVARELGIPTVIGVKNIVEQLHDYQLISLDGDAGTIQIIEE